MFRLRVHFKNKKKILKVKYNETCDMERRATERRKPAKLKEK
jgi:hypothetical protein